MGEYLQKNYDWFEDQNESSTPDINEDNFVPPEPGLVPEWIVFEGDRPIRAFSKFKDMHPWYLSYKKNCLDVNERNQVKFKLYWKFKEL